MYLKCSRNKVEMSEEEIFRKFRPYCAVLASQPSAECLAKLAALCDDTAAAELELVQEYLVFPAQLHLKTRAAGTPRNFTLAVLEYLRTLYKRIRLASLFNSKDLLTSCLGAGGPGGGRGPAAVSVLHADPAAGGCPGRRGGGDGGPGQRDEAAAEPPGVQ